MQFNDLKPIDLSKIKSVPFPDSQYFKQEYQKTQIVLHHTMSGNGVSGDIATWEADPKRIATCIIIDRDGVPWQLFSSKYWAGHIGASNLWLDRHSIGVELDNWGWLIPDNGAYRTYYGNIVDVSTQYYPNGFRGYQYYERYTDAQIKTLGELLLFWNKKYNIPLTYNEDMWNVSLKALTGQKGVWTHVSYRPAPEKTDCHPQPNLIDMLKSLEHISK